MEIGLGLQGVLGDVPPVKNEEIVWLVNSKAFKKPKKKKKDEVETINQNIKLEI